MGRWETAVAKEMPRKPISLAMATAMKSPALKGVRERHKDEP